MGLPIIALVATGIGGLVQAVGAQSQAKAAAQTANYNASVANVNAQQAKNNATLAANAGEEQAAIQSQKTKAAVGSIVANQAAGGIDVNSGSALDVRESATELGSLDALTIRSNAAKEAYGYQTQANSFSQQAGLDTASAKNDIAAGNINTASTLLGTAGSALTTFQKFQIQGGLGSAGESTGSDFGGSSWDEDM